MRKKSFIKTGIYAYVLLLFAGVSYAFYDFEFHGSVELEGMAYTLDTRPPEPLPDPDHLDDTAYQNILDWYNELMQEEEPRGEHPEEQPEESLEQSEEQEEPKSEQPAQEEYSEPEQIQSE